MAVWLFFFLKGLHDYFINYFVYSTIYVYLIYYMKICLKTVKRPNAPKSPKYRKTSKIKCCLQHQRGVK